MNYFKLIGKKPFTSSKLSYVKSNNMEISALFLSLVTLPEAPPTIVLLTCEHAIDRSLIRYVMSLIKYLESWDWKRVKPTHAHSGEIAKDNACLHHAWDTCLF